jgi:hypothetical protein
MGERVVTKREFALNRTGQVPHDRGDRQLLRPWHSTTGIPDRRGPSEGVELRVSLLPPLPGALERSRTRLAPPLRSVATFA